MDEVLAAVIQLYLLTANKKDTGYLKILIIEIICITILTVLMVHYRKIIHSFKSEMEKKSVYRGKIS